MRKPALLLRTGDDLNILDASADAGGLHLRLHRPGSEKQVVVNLRGTDLGLARLIAVVAGQFAAVLAREQSDAESKRQAAWEEYVKSFTGEELHADVAKAGGKKKPPS